MTSKNGCAKCSVNKMCQTSKYRGSACISLRTRYELGDPMTKGDEIRAMSDEELALFINEISNLCNTDAVVHPTCVGCKKPYCSYSDAMGWISSPVKEE